MMDERSESPAIPLSSTVKLVDTAPDVNPVGSHDSCPYERFKADAYSQDNNDGIIQLAYAENRLIWDVLEPKLRSSRNVPERVTRCQSPSPSPSLASHCRDHYKLATRITITITITVGVTTDEYAYGSAELRKEFAKLCSRTTVKPVDASNLVMTSGCEAALDLLLRCVADPGDGIAVIVPAFHGFFNAIEMRNRLITIPIEIDVGPLPSAEAICDLVENALKQSDVQIKAM